MKKILISLLLIVILVIIIYNLLLPKVQHKTYEYVYFSNGRVCEGEIKVKKMSDDYIQIECKQLASGYTKTYVTKENNVILASDEYE